MSAAIEPIETTRPPSGIVHEDIDGTDACCERLDLLRDRRVESDRFDVSVDLYGGLFQDRGATARDDDPVSAGGKSGCAGAANSGAAARDDNCA